MSYKKATRLKIRFQSDKGPLSIEQLWDLSVEELDVIAVSLKDEYEASGKKSFLATQTRKDVRTKIAFDVVLDVLNTKLEDANNSLSAQEAKKHNEKIDELILAKKEASMKDLTIEELEKLKK